MAEETRMKKLLIMLTRLPGPGSRMISLLTGSRYTHASIALGEDPGTFFSFTIKGFHIEHPHGLLRKEYEPFPCRIYYVNTTDKAYQKAKRLILRVNDDRDCYGYSVIGIISALFRIPFTTRRRFFCSHFVAEILARSGALRLWKRSCLFLPGDLQKIVGLSLSFTGTVQEYAWSLA